MASSRISSNMPDWKDVARTWLAFQDIHDAQLIVTLTPDGSWTHPNIILKAELVRQTVEPMGVLCLAFTSARMDGHGYGDIATALLAVGYLLDTAYEAELERRRTKNA